jgi:hypothetical protein
MREELVQTWHCGWSSSVRYDRGSRLDSQE